MSSIPAKSIPRSLSRAIGGLPLPRRVGPLPSNTVPTAVHGPSARPPFSYPQLVVLPHPARFDPARLAGGIPRRRTMPATVAGRLGSITAGIAARLGGFRPHRLPPGLPR
jgi:hypothetical protein